jgi:hypothetical protein
LLIYDNMKKTFLGNNSNKSMLSVSPRHCPEHIICMNSLPFTLTPCIWYYFMFILNMRKLRHREVVELVLTHRREPMLFPDTLHLILITANNNYSHYNIDLNACNLLLR